MGKSSFKKIMEYYGGGFRQEKDEDTGKLYYEYLITFSPHPIGIEMIACNDEEASHYLVEIMLNKNKNDFKPQLRGGGVTYSLNNLKRISPLLTFRKTSKEKNADLLYRILKQAQEFKRVVGASETEKKVDVIEFFETNLRKPIHLVYYSDNRKKS